MNRIGHFVPKRIEPDFQPQVAPPAFVLALADRIHKQSELLARRAEKPPPRPWWEQANDAEGGYP